MNNRKKGIRSFYRKFLHFLALFCLMITACSGGGGGDDLGVMAPGGLQYGKSEVVYFVGKEIEANAPDLAQGRATQFRIEPDLAKGLVIDPATGVISGTPEQAMRKEESSSVRWKIKELGLALKTKKDRAILTQTHTITASNPAGSTSTTVKITVSDDAPTNLQYTRTKVTYYPGMEIIPNVPEVTGGAESYRLIDRALPADLSLDPKTGIITGIPRSNAPEAEYTIEAKNPFGVTKIVLTIGISNALPANLRYPDNPAVYYPGSQITPNIPSVEGSVERFSIVPDLPEGLLLNEFTGVISGTPGNITPVSDYTVTAENRIDKTTLLLQIGILVVGPENLRYSENPAVYFPGVSIVPNVPSVNGGVTEYSVSPELPEGLSLDKATGIVYGTPAFPVVAQDYRIRAINPVGMAEVDLNIAVSDSPVPANLRYSHPQAVYFFGNEIIPNQPAVEGLVTSFSILPNLPEGLDFSKKGVISGIPVQPSPLTAYLVTASNPLGSATATLNLEVTNKPPLNLTYSQNPAIYYRTQAIPANIPHVTGIATSYAVSPDLPQGLLLDTQTGYITGTPEIAVAQSNFFVSASNPMGSTVVPLVVTIYPETPSFLQQPASLALDPGASATFSVVCEGISPLSYQWYKDGSLIQGATSSSYTIASVNEGHEGDYTCLAANSKGQTMSQIATLAVKKPPSIVVHPQSQVKNPNAKVVFSVVATGTAPFSYEWTKDGNNIPGATLSSYTISSAQYSHEGVYVCYVSNPYGVATSEEATLTVNRPPSIVAHPESKVVDPGQLVNFTVVANSSSPLSYQWEKDSSPISGATNASYQIASAALAQEGNYRCVVSNIVGSVTSNQASLSINRPPVITSHPQNQLANVGNNVSFVVVAQGSAPISYQWRKDGSPVAGATSAIYTILSATKAHEGSYSCLVSNSAGNTTSNAATLSVNFLAPNITLHPVSQTVNPGSSVLFLVEAEGSPTLTYQWQKDSQNIAGATFSSFQIVSVSASDAASYRCVVTNNAGNATSNAALLTVNAVPVITTHPQSQAIELDNPVSFSVAATGTEPLSYQWRKDGSDIVGATLSTYSIAKVALSHQGSYVCVVSNVAGNVFSQQASLTVLYAPTITRQPVSQTVNPGNSVYFIIEAQGSPEPTYQWQKDGNDIPGEVFASYQIVSVKQEDKGDYRCLVSNIIGNVPSDIATLAVNIPPTITKQPISQTVNLGSNVSFSVEATGTLPLSYQWRKEGNNISDATSANYSIDNVKAEDQGLYSCLVSNITGSISSQSASLSINLPPTIKKQPASQTVNPGSNVLFSIEVEGTAPLQYQWRKNGVDIPGETQSNYTIALVSKSHQGEYTCYVSNIVGNILSEVAILAVNDTIPVILQQPEDVLVSLGSQASFQVVAEGMSPLSYQWKKNDEEIAGANNAIFSIPSVQTDDIAGYSCFISNPMGSTSSRVASLTLQNSPPYISVHPQSQTVAPGSLVTLSVSASGEGPLSYQWKKNNINIDNATNNVYTIASAQSGDAATYLCVVSNLYGSTISREATLFLMEPPTIVVHPESQTKNPGESVNFMVLAHGSGTLTYQWQKNQTNLDNAIFSYYQIAFVAKTDEGSYRCIVSNSSGSTTSQAALLNVKNPPTITVQPQPITITEKESFQFSVTAIGSLPLWYQWQIQYNPWDDFEDIPGATFSTYSQITSSEEDAGSYRCIVSNSAGSIMSHEVSLEMKVIPKVIGTSWYLDANRNHLCDAGDQLIVPFNLSITLQNPVSTDFVLPVYRDIFGTGALVRGGSVSNEVIITLGSNPHINTRFYFSSNNTIAGAPSGIDISTTTSSIVSEDHGISAAPSTPIDIGAGFVEQNIANSPSALALATEDINKDGKLDIVYKTTNGIKIYINNGNGVFSDSGQTLGDATTSCLALGDIDQDGDIDIVSGSYGNTIRVYTNHGTGTFTDSGQNLGSYNTLSLALGDVNRDGNLDIVQGNDEQPNRVYLNDGTGTFSDSSQTLGNYKTQSIFLSDVNKDGKLDMIEGNDEQPNRVYLNDGTGTFTDSNQTLGNYKTRSLALGDMDNDGDVDIIEGIEGITGPPFVAYYQNNGSGIFSEIYGKGIVSPFSYSVPCMTAIQLCDLDSDGLLDEIWGDTNGQITILLLSNNTSDYYYPQTLGSYTTKALALGDMDQDGDMDIIEGVETASSPGIYIYYNSLSGARGSSIFTDANQSLGSYNTKSMALGDVDGDGDSDLIEGNSSQENRIYRNNGKGIFSDSGQLPGDYHVTYAIALGDVNQDGSLDIVEGNLGEGNRVYGNNGSGVFSDSGQSLGNYETYALVLGDIDNDGDLDIVEGNYNQANRIWLNNGNGIFTDSNQALGNDGTECLALGDVNQDGYLDIIEGGGLANRVWLNDRTGSFTDSGQSLGTTSSSIALGDLNKDGHLDIVYGVRSQVQGKRVWLNDGTGVFTDSGQTLSSYYAKGLALGDINGDGHLDIIQGLENQKTRIWLNNGSAQFTESDQNLNAYKTYSILIGDVDGDGDLDIIEGNYGEANRVYFNQ